MTVLTQQDWEQRTQALTVEARAFIDGRYQAALGGATFDDLLAQKLVHKTVLSVLSWIVFGVLLIGRHRYGWRGLKAVHWTLSAMVLLLLAFFGSQFAIELVFGHTAR